MSHLTNTVAAAAQPQKWKPLIQITKEVLLKILGSDETHPIWIYSKLYKFLRSKEDWKDLNAILLKKYISLIVRLVALLTIPSRFMRRFLTTDPATVQTWCEDLRRHSFVLKLMYDITEKKHVQFCDLYTTIDELLDLIERVKKSDDPVDIESLRTQFLEDYKKSEEAELDLADLKEKKLKLLKLKKNLEEEEE